MKLVYVWVSNYRNFIIEQGFQITNDLIVDTNYSEEKNIINIEIKENYSETLYKNNIIDVSAIVGKNGSGKTSVATMILDYMPNNFIINIDGITSSYDNKKEEKSIYIFIDDNKKIKVFTRNIKINIRIEGCTDKQIKEKYDVIHDGNNSYLGKINMIYISNVFNIAELRDNYYERNTNANGIQIQQMFTPSFILKHSAEEYRKSFPYKATNNRYLVAIQQYAYNMSTSDIQCYIKRQEQLFFNCYENMSPDERELLGIFNEYILEVGGFDTNNISIRRNVNNEEDDIKFRQINTTINDAGIIYKNFKKRIENNRSMWLEIYILLLSEVYLGFGGSQNPIMKKIKNMANSSEKINEIDIEILSEIEKVLEHSELKGSQWYLEVIDCIKQIKEYYFELKKQWTLGKRKFYQEEDEERGIIAWYIGELKKENSFFKRNVYFRQLPTSSGELAFINLYAYIYEALKKIQTKSNIVLVIDELDAYMHPEWQQMIINKLVVYLQRLSDYNFQIIITTHSPIVLSDIPNNNIIFLEKENNKIKVVNNSIRTFGANIYDLYKNSFFLKDNNYGVLGDFATEKIYEVENILSEMLKQIQLITEEAEKEAEESLKDIDILNKEKYIIEKTEIIRNGMIYNIRESYIVKLNECKKLIDIIGEQFIRKTLLKKYNQIREIINIDIKNDSENLIEIKDKFEKLSKDDQNELIKFIIDRRKN